MKESIKKGGSNSGCSPSASGSVYRPGRRDCLALLCGLFLSFGLLGLGFLGGLFLGFGFGLFLGFWFLDLGLLRSFFLGLLSLSLAGRFFLFFQALVGLPLLFRQYRSVRP